MTWNVQGLKNRLSLCKTKVIDFLLEFDVINLQETWAENSLEFRDLLNNKGYTGFSTHYQKTSKYGRCPGGVVVYIKNSVLEGIKRISTDFRFGVVFMFDQAYFCLSKNLILLCLYLPPEGSASYEPGVDGMDVVGSKLDSLREQYDEAHVCILGDLNARTAACNDYIVDDLAKHMPNEEWYIPDLFNIKRRSQDNVINTYGKKLLDICKEHCLHMCNGRKNDTTGNFTHVSMRGSSVIDYCLVDTDLFDLVSYFAVGQEDFGSDHLPCDMKLNVNIESRTLSGKSGSLKERVRYRWKAERCEEFMEKLYLNADKCLSYFDNTLKAGHIDDAVNVLHDMITNAAQCMLCVQGGTKRNGWWDNECEKVKYEKCEKLKLYRRDRTMENLHRYVTLRKALKRLCKEKKDRYKRIVQGKIRDNLTDTTKCWRTLKSLTRGSGNECTIEVERWFSHFRNMLNVNSEIDDVHKSHVHSVLDNHAYRCEVCETNEPLCLNREFDLTEVVEVIECMSNNKAPGIDGIVAEMLKSGQVVLAPFLLKLFNAVLTQGVFPSVWSKAILLPIHKKGSVNDVNNYRGIALLSVVGKVFTKCLCMRLTKYYTENNLFCEEQAGFRKCHSTIDQLFVLQSCVQKYLSKPKGRMYCVFIDFARAFDSVPHDTMFYKLMNDGVHGNFFKVLLSMYSKLSSCIVVENGKYLSELFDCSIGTRQGCMLSPLLFIIYLNTFIAQCADSGCAGVYLDENFSNLMLLLFADDMLEMSDTVARLQKLLNELELFCSKWGLTVNLDKTKVMVFRKGGRVRRNEKWYFKGQQLETVPFYKYVGLMTTSRLNWTLAQKTLACQATKSIFVIKKANVVSGGLPPDMLINLFDKLVLPILLYGSEIWGCDVHKCIEMVHVKFLKYVLGLPLNAPNAAVIGECGRYPIRMYAAMRAVKYWLKVSCMGEDRLPKSALKMQVALDERNKKCWVTGIRELLYKYGFGVVYLEGSVGCINGFMNQLKERMCFQYCNEWLNDVAQNGRLQTYATFKTMLEPERYLVCIENRLYRKALAQFRCSCHQFMIERGRHLNIPRNERVCTSCNVLEDEKHVLINCTKYKEIRQCYLPEIVSQKITFTEIMGSKNDATIKQLVKYVYAIMKCNFS